MYLCKTLNKSAGKNTKYEYRLIELKWSKQIKNVM